MKLLQTIGIGLGFAFWSAPSVAQHAQIIVDMESMEMLTPEKCLGLDNTAVLTLINVNPLTTTITITSKNVKVYTEQNGTTKLLTGFPDSKAGEVLGDLTTATAPVANTEETEEELSDLERERDIVEERKDVVLKQKKGLVTSLALLEGLKGASLRTKVNELGFAEQTNLDTLDESAMKHMAKESLDRDLAEVNDWLEKYEYRVGQLDAEIAELKAHLKELKNDPYVEAYTDLRYMAEQVYNGWKDLNALGVRFKVLETTMKDPCLSVAELRARMERCGEEFLDECFNEEELLLTGALDQFERAYESFLLEPMVTKRLSADDEEKKRVTGLKNAVAAVRKEYAKNDYAAIIAGYHAFYNSMRSEAAYVINSLPVQAEEDFIEFEVTVEAKQGTSGACTPKAGTFTFKQYICGGVKVDFGTGPVALFGVQDESYRLEADPSNADNSIIMKDTDQQDAQPALMATIHISRRTVARVKPDLMLGGGIDMTKFENVTLVLGGGVMFGRDPWVAVHAGPVLRPVQRLKGSLELERSYATSALDATALVEAKYKVGWFVGVSFLFPKRDD